MGNSFGDFKLAAELAEQSNALSVYCGWPFQHLGPGAVRVRPATPALNPIFRNVSMLLLKNGETPGAFAG